MLILPRSSTSAKAVLQNEEASQKSGKCESLTQLARHQQLQTEMSWRNRLNVEHSQAEEDVLIELQRRGLMRNLAPLDTVILMSAHKVLILTKDKVTRDLLESEKEDVAVTFTVPDLILRPEGQKPIPIYLDGPPHKKHGRMWKDECIDKKLREIGFEPIRFKYVPPLSKRALKQICDKIEEFIKNGNDLD